MRTCEPYNLLLPFMDILSVARQTVQLEAESLLGMLPFLDTSFEKVVRIVYDSPGRLVISGIGKSAIIAQKIVATLNSTGTPSLYMHAADAIHGDLGMIQPNDTVMLISRSGNSPEIKVLVPLVKNFGNTVIGMVGNLQSFLALQSDYVLNTTVSVEACPNNLAPTSSTTAQMVMGDTLAVCLMNMRGFTGEDFAKFHPGGSLGRQLYLQVKDLLMHNDVPQVAPNTPLRLVIGEMTKKRLGATAVVEENGSLYGIITDGDLRRMLEKNENLQAVQAKDICTRSPKTITPDALAVNALDILRRHDITQLVVVENGKYLGLLHLHDLIKEGFI
jgi:arabinose-5-phosphate isomerase